MMAEDAGGEHFVKQADNLITKELSRLSVQDRNDINEEIHGVRSLARDETPEDLARSLGELDTVLSRMITNPASLRNAFDFGQRETGSKKITERNERDHVYVNDTNFRLRFLRCERFDAEKAAIRMIKYLDLILTLWGENALRRQIQLTDFSKDEMKLMRSGCIQVLPYRDRAGRPILAFVGDMGFHYSTRLKIKVLLYILYIVGDTESQQKGLVVLTWPSHDSVFPNFSCNNSDKELVERFLESTSIRLCAIHACFPDTFKFRMLRPVIAGALCPSDRPRLKFFVATEVDRQYIFKGYGIPTKNIPITETGNVKIGYLRQWIKLRTLFESKDNNDVVNKEEMGKNPLTKQQIVAFPGSSDVLYRTGTTTLCHPGNAAFRNLIESNMEGAQFSSSVSFSTLADELIDAILQIRKGRFLKWNNSGYWTVLSDRAQINSKVTASIRDFNRWKSATNNIQSLDSSTLIFEEQQGQKRRKRTSNDA